MKRYILMQGEDVIGECWTDDPDMLPISSSVSAIPVDRDPIEPPLIEGSIVSPNGNETPHLSE